MSFHFSLATVLRLREIAEEREERMLGQILSQIVDTKRSIVQLIAQREAVLKRRSEALKMPMAIADLHLSYAQVESLNDLEKAADENLVKLETLRVQQVKIYEAAHRSCELLEGMREEQLEEFRVQETKREQSLMDDNFTSRRARF